MVTMNAKVLCVIKSIHNASRLALDRELQQFARVFDNDVRARLTQGVGVVIAPRHADGERAGVARHQDVPRRIAHVRRAGWCGPQLVDAAQQPRGVGLARNLVAFAILHLRRKEKQGAPDQKNGAV